jgi:hypothetical protein
MSAHQTSLMDEVLWPSCKVAQEQGETPIQDSGQVAGRRSSWACALAAKWPELNAYDQQLIPSSLVTGMAQVLFKKKVDLRIEDHLQVQMPNLQSDIQGEQ